MTTPFGRLFATNPFGDKAARARIFAYLRITLLWLACAHIALLAISGFTFLRGLAFGLALGIALWLILGAIFSDGEHIPPPHASLWCAFLVWAGWAALSVAWSIHPEYTSGEIATELVWGIGTAVVFYVAIGTDLAFRAIATTVVGTGGFLAVLAVCRGFTGETADVEQIFLSYHGGVGAYSTYIALTMPFAPLLLAPKPVGYGLNLRTISGAIVLLPLLIAAARLTQNRMIWMALIASLVLSAFLAFKRWRAVFSATTVFWSCLLIASVLLLNSVLIDVMSERARGDFKAEMTLGQSIAADPRSSLWQHVVERLRDRPWTGYGFGKLILREELQARLGDARLPHAHNMFLSQWLQTGGVGAIALLAVFAAVTWRYLTFLRGPDSILSAVGLVGLAMLLSFVVKNLTDDFLVRPTSKEFWALNAALFGYGFRRANRRTLMTIEPPKTVRQGKHALL